MTITQRRIVYSLFFLLFFIISPLIVLYATGYRLDLTSGSISKVGALYIKTYPSGAKVYRNNLYTKRKTPTQIVNIPSGLQTISVIKDGYQPWTKELRIEAGKTTFVEDIVLFRETFTSEKLGAGGSQLVLSPDRELAAYADNNNKLAIVNLTAGTIDTSIILPAASRIKRWSQDHSRLAYQTREQWNIVDIGSQKVWPLANYIKGPISNLHFGSTGDDIWVQAGSSLWRLNLLTGKKQIAANETKDFYITADSLVQLSSDNHLLLAKITTNSQQVYALPAGDYQYIADFRNDVVLLQGNNQFFIWSNEQLRDTISATQFDWRKNKIILTNGYDIWRYDTADQSTTLLDRTGSQPQLIRWHPSESYITEVVGGQIQIIELDNRGEKRHLITIAPLSQGDYTFDPKGEKIYILTDKDFQQLTIQ
ncbi:MAG: PEGA domain-containing protein [Candidatus Komeilibacteria bacterium]